MSEAPHTQGVWKIRRSNDGSGDVGITVDGLPNVLAECFGSIRHRGERASDEAMANALLVAAAPDMLTSLKRLLLEFDFLVEGGDLPDIRGDIIFIDARAAIAKAEGR